MSKITMMDLEFLEALCNKMAKIGSGIIDDNGGLHVDFICLNRYQELAGVEATLRAWIKQEELITEKELEQKNKDEDPHSDHMAVFGKLQSTIRKTNSK